MRNQRNSMNFNLSDYLPLPVTDPVLVFSIILFVILLAPVLLNRFRIPSIVGLILAGVMLGPYGLHILDRDNAIILFGTVGVLYIMFLAGLEIDLVDFKKNRNKSIIFGLSTFLIPITIGTYVCQNILKFELLPSILVASTFSSNTLIAYPIASRLGINKSRAVNITVGGTMITDILALLVLAVISSSARGNLDAEFFARLALSFGIFSFVVLWGFPKIARWFFKNFQTEGTSQYIFVMAMVFMAGFLAKMAGVEPIIGSFLAGLAFNRLIPHTSPLKNRLEFVGNALFIPFFLISIGMLVNVRVFWSGETAIVVSLTMTAMALVGKWIPAFLTQKLFNLSKYERKIIFGLTAAHAAATLAVVQQGFELGLLNTYILNGTIVMVLITCLTSSFVVETAGRKMAVIENEKAPDLTGEPERILVPISDPNTFEKLIDFSLMIQPPRSIEPIYPLSVVTDEGEHSAEKVLGSHRMLEKIKRYAAASDRAVQVITRVDLNVANGIQGAIKDLLITQVVIGWGGSQQSAKDKILGTMLESLLRKTEKMILLTKIEQPLNTLKKIAVVVPPKAEFEKGFTVWFNTVRTLSKETGASVLFFASRETNLRIARHTRASGAGISVKFNTFDDWEDFLILSRDISENDLFVVISARAGSLSYMTLLDGIPKKLMKHFPLNSCVIIYPEQNPSYVKEMDFQTEGMDVSPIQENLDRLTRVGKALRKVFGKG